MKIALLQCDYVAPALVPKFGDQPVFFKNLFSKHAPEVTLDTFDVQKEQYPSDPDQYDGFIGTGAKYSVTENAPWIQRFKEYVRYLHEKTIQFIGICFGHQMIAEALGGKCEVSDKGWGIGVRKIDIFKKKEWMTPDADSVSLLYSHMDQIVTLPPQSEVLAGNDHCPYAVITANEHFLGIQAHPEFTPAYLDQLMQSRIDRIGGKNLKEAQHTLKEKTDEDIITKWMVNFFRLSAK